MKKGQVLEGTIEKWNFPIKELSQLQKKVNL